MSALEPCKFCHFCIPENAQEGRCHREAPGLQRGTEKATWPKVDLDKPGCGKFKPAGSVAP